MIAPVPQRIAISREELRAKYDAENWADRLRNCDFETLEDVAYAPDQGRNTLRKQGRKYYEGGQVIAVVFAYRRTDGERLSVRMLRGDDGTVYHC